jgi:Mrp family chromosome partitioning ATPase
MVPVYHKHDRYISAMTRFTAHVPYLWMSARARNAMRRATVMGIVGGLVFISALIAFVLGPRQATRAATMVSAGLEERRDTTAVARMRDRSSAEIAAVDSLLAVARRNVVVSAVVPVDTFPPELVAQRESLAAVVGTLNRLIERADNAPLPASYRALGLTPVMSTDDQVQVLLDSLAAIERERDAFGAVGGVDPVYVALTSRATALGRQIQAIAEAKRGLARSQLAVLRPAAPPALPQIRVDTMKYVARKLDAQRTYTGSVRTLAEMRATNRRIDLQASKARELANVGAPPLAMLGAALVLAIAIGFGASFGGELRRPHVADAREAEQVTGARVLTVVRPGEVMAERSRRQADAEAPPLIDIISESYRRLYLHLAATGADVPVVTVAGEDAAIVATIAANLAAAAAFEARSTLLVDVDSTTSTVAGVLRVRSNPGLADIIAGSAGWAESIVSTTIGRDRPLDVLPSGTRRAGMPSPEVAEKIRGDFARMERRYDLIVIAAPTAYVLHRMTTIIPSPDVVLCARVAHTRIADLRRSVEKLREMNLRVHGLVLWDDDQPQIEAVDESAKAQAGAMGRSPGLATVR